MAGPDLILFDDRTAREWMPFVLTRPAGELRFGAYTLRERVERAFGAACAGHLTDPELSDFEEPDAAPALDPATMSVDRDLLLVTSRYVPAPDQTPPTWPDRPATLLAGSEPVGWYLPAGSALPPADALLDPAAASLPAATSLPVHGFTLRGVWELVTRAHEVLASDVNAAAATRAPFETGPGVHRLGDAPLVVGERVQIEPEVVLDLRSGPIWLDDDATIRAFTRLAGPAYVGKGSALLGGHYDGVVIGPGCKVRGELEASTILGYSNKAHDGFLGHSYVGSWVNLGAMTTTSDLKNNYHTIRLELPSGAVDTGEIKLGCLIGDHVKTGIGTLLNTGSILGAGSMVVGPTLPPKGVAPFTWWTDGTAAGYDPEKFLETVEVVMARRNRQLTERQRNLLRTAWQRTRPAQ